MSIETNNFYVEICDLCRLYRLISPLAATNIEMTIVVSNDGLRFVTETALQFQTIIYYNSKNIKTLKFNSGDNFVIIKIPTRDFLDTLMGCGHNSIVAKLIYDEKKNEDSLYVIIDETITKTTFTIPASSTIITTVFNESKTNIVQVCTLLSKPLSNNIQYVSEYVDNVKLVLSSEGIYFFSECDGCKFECNILLKSENIIEISSCFVDIYWYTANSLKKLLPYLNLAKYCKIKISRFGTLECKVEFNDSKFSVNTVQIWIAGIHDPNIDINKK
ncbi:Hypothetical protein SRAE_2000008500 [Strongyloides ratti]|uniref:Uncharacterized protein n=1 Tax=Strongyloides ratti TaxID=34506 RepID=A0A090LD13_STRRB|nr:Hypothetical protein SRAE_2000008500 [Strongyloides ratti]CEF65405.1 Hypothetical protein SRAE_2000008500 [Strongyloides ratti]